MAFVAILAEEQHVPVQRSQLVVAQINGDVLEVGEGQISQQALGQFADVRSGDSQYEVGGVIETCGENSVIVCSVHQDRGSKVN